MVGNERENKDYKENPPIDKLVRQFRGDGLSDIESFNDYFKRNSVSSSATHLRSSLADTIKPLPKQNNISDGAKFSSQKAVREVASNHASSTKKSEAVSNMGSQISVDKLSKHAIKSTGIENEHQVGHQEAKFSSWWLLELGLLFGVFLIRWWFRKK